MRKKIAILTGGNSSERSVALASAKMVEEALFAKYDTRRYVFPEEIDRFLHERNTIEIAIPVFHGRGGEDGGVQGFLETLGIKFVFSGIEAQVIAANKWLAKQVVAQAGINTPKAQMVFEGQDVDFVSPVVIKPIDGGSSVGVSVVRRADELGAALVSAFQEAQKVLVEDFIEGDEYSVPVAETSEGLRSLPVIAIKTKTGFFDFASKYDSSLSEEICPAPIASDLNGKLQATALRAHQAIGAKHVSRSDFIVDRTGKIWFLEINTIPGMTENSLLPKAVRAAGLDFGELLSFWISEAS